MAQLPTVGRKWVVGGCLLIAGLLAVGGGWLKRDSLLARYYLARMASSEGTAREAWEARCAALGEGAWPVLLGCLADGSPHRGADAEAVLQRMTCSAGAELPLRARLLERLAGRFASFDSDGQEQALHLASRLASDATAPLTEAAAREALAALVQAASQSADASVHAAALALASSQLGQRDQRCLAPIRLLVPVCLHDREPAVQVAAIRLAASPGVDQLDEVVKLLHDPSPQVRRAALLTVGNAPQVLDTDDLLRWLHDADTQVRRLCEVALLSRGLSDEHINIGRFLTDPNPRERLRVLDFLHYHPELAAGAWLRRLSNDPAPAVRVAAIRAAGLSPSLDMSDRLAQLAENDPSATVRQVASYYLASLDPPIR